MPNEHAAARGGAAGRIAQLRGQLDHLRRTGNPQERTYHALDLAAEHGPLPAALGIDGSGHVHLFLPVPQGSAVLEDRRSQGVRLTRHVLMAGGHQQLHADLECTLPHLEETFLHLADEILERMRVVSTRPDGLAREALARWRELLDAPACEVLSREKLAGLYGELSTLLEFPDPAAMLACWTGPAGQRHDFEFTSDALEVKTTRTTTGDKVVISGLTQLDAPVRGRLYLRRLKVEEGPGGHCVPELVDRLIDAGSDRVELFTRLASAGYRPEMEARCREFRLQTTDAAVWEVDEDFPKIVPASFAAGSPPPGTEVVSYTADLTRVAVRRLPAVRWSELTGTWKGGAVDA